MLEGIWWSQETSYIPGWWWDVGLIDPGHNRVNILQHSIRLSNSVEFFGYEIWNLKHQKLL